MQSNFNRSANSYRALTINKNVINTCFYRKLMTLQTLRETQSIRLFHEVISAFKYETNARQHVFNVFKRNWLTIFL